MIQATSQTLKPVQIHLTTSTTKDPHRQQTTATTQGVACSPLKCIADDDPHEWQPPWYNVVDPQCSTIDNALPERTARFPEGCPEGE
ncbi:hypothetical protein SCLCIDRAFT_1225168 [Scleroderma citrinum Foug A]|uniref:Uncharacterized protein n=1 Tax=Scleroderma citrinum Foug A TaxID=1036808 RepID=A0A0C3CQ79_9AGAM|nr:hypothetical protein SCLCIDRAFT_1225168 [Scleroderma citrinum Foug A]